MRSLTPILYGLVLCTLLVFVVKLSIPAVPEGMVLIPASDGIDAFYMDVYEVTNAQYREFIDENRQWQKDRALTSIVGDTYLAGWNGNMYPKGKANHPVVNVSWFARERLCGMGGQGIANRGTMGKSGARCSLEGKKYPWGNAKPRKRANYNRYTTPPAQVSETRRRKRSVVMPPTYTVYTIWRVMSKNGA